MNQINQLREYIRNILRAEKKRQKKQAHNDFMNEHRLRREIRKIIKEADDVISHESTGINVLADLLETIVPILKSYYKKLGTDVEQRKSFRAHIIKSVQNLLSPVAIMFKAGGFAGKPEEANTELNEEEVEEEIKVDVKNPDDPAFIPLKADREAEKEAEKEQQVAKDPKAEDVFVPIAGEDETGRNIALQSFKRVEKQIREAYSLLANEEDRELFYDYLITNLKLYFDKFEDELQVSVPEPTTPEYEEEKARKEAELTAGLAGGEEGTVPETPEEEVPEEPLA
jgi:hypothetical protein